MAATYSNLPGMRQTDNSTLQAFDTYFSQPIEIKVSTLNSMVSFFTSKGFDQTAAENVALVIITQAKKDNLNPMQVLDTLRGLGEVEISALVAEIINFNRFKTSFLGYTRGFQINQEVSRNVMP
jgi:hypothetical protein